MSTTITGVVSNGVIIPNSPLPDGAHVEIQLNAAHPAVTSEATVCLKAGEVRKLPRAQRQAVLAAAAVLAEEDYRTDKELTGFEAFGEEELDGD